MTIKINAGDKMNNQKLSQLIELFLQINCQPSDQQFHALAEALGVDKETLESLAYEMLSEDVNDEEPEVDAVSTHFPESEEEEDFGIVNASMRLKLTAGGNKPSSVETLPHPLKFKEKMKKAPDWKRKSIGAPPKDKRKTTAGDIEPEEPLSEQQEVLQGEGDISTTNTDNLMLTDGAPEGESTDDTMQDSLLVDGVGEDDAGVGIETDKSMLLNDGAPALQLTNAANRLLAASGKTGSSIVRILMTKYKGQKASGSMGGTGSHKKSSAFFKKDISKPIDAYLKTDGWAKKKDSSGKPFYEKDGMTANITHSVENNGWFFSITEPDKNFSQSGPVYD